MSKYTINIPVESPFNPQVYRPDGTCFSWNPASLLHELNQLWKELAGVRANAAELVACPGCCRDKDPNTDCAYCRLDAKLVDALKDRDVWKSRAEAWEASGNAMCRRLDEVVKERDDALAEKDSAFEVIRSAMSVALADPSAKKTTGLVGTVSSIVAANKTLHEMLDTAEEERDEWKARAEKAERLSSLPNVMPALQSTPFLHEIRPSRLQIAAMVLQGMWANPGDFPCSREKDALLEADALIAAEKEVAK